MTSETLSTGARMALKTVDHGGDSQNQAAERERPGNRLKRLDANGDLDHGR
jgi:hypothetical protein